MAGCQCRTFDPDDIENRNTGQILYCSLHSAAPTLLEALKTVTAEFMTATDTGPCVWCGGKPGRHINAGCCPFAKAEAAIKEAEA